MHFYRTRLKGGEPVKHEILIPFIVIALIYAMAGGINLYNDKFILCIVDGFLSIGAIAIGYHLARPRNE